MQMLDTLFGPPLPPSSSSSSSSSSAAAFPGPGGPPGSRPTFGKAQPSAHASAPVTRRASGRATGTGTGTGGHMGGGVGAGGGGGGGSGPDSPGAQHFGHGQFPQQQQGRGSSLPSPSAGFHQQPAHLRQQQFLIQQQQQQGEAGGMSPSLSPGVRRAGSSSRSVTYNFPPPLAQHTAQQHQHAQQQQQQHSPGLLQHGQATGSPLLSSSPSQHSSPLTLSGLPSLPSLPSLPFAQQQQQAGQRADSPVKTERNASMR